MTRCMITFLLALITRTQVVKGAWDYKVCSPVPDKFGPVKLDLPESFSVRVEVNLLDKNSTKTLHEYFDYDDNMGAMREMVEGEDNYFFYYYSSNQYLAVLPDDNGVYSCFSQDLSQNENKEMFGLNKTANGTEKIFSVYGALHFTGFPENYLGHTTVRGINCNSWQSCQYWPELNATANVWWYFSDESQWSSISGYSAPVRCHVKGVVHTNDSYSYPFEHIYEFYDFRTDLYAAGANFEVPPNTYCESENNTKPLPTLPQAFSFNMELVDLPTKTIEFYREFYDNTSRLIRYDHRLAPQENSPYGLSYMSIIHDFDTGIAYQVDVLRANCSITLLAQNDFDDVNVGQKVRMRNPIEFLDLDHPYIYQGVRTVRDIECDSWAAQRFDYPDPTQIATNPSTTWTWYFATTNWMKNMGYRDNFVMPVMLEVFSNSDPKNPIDKIMNFYGYNAEEPDIMSYDISSCYGPNQSKNVAFLVPGRFRDIVGNSLRLFKYFVMLSIINTIPISPLRISRMDVQEAGRNVLVTFDLLDKANLPGDIANPPQEMSVDQAYTQLTNAIANHQLQIILQPDLRRLPARPAGPQYQFRPLSSSRKRRSSSAPDSSSGYTGGAMAGMAVGMLILGALLGFGIMFGVHRVRQGGDRSGGVGFGKGTSLQPLDSDKEKHGDD